MAIVMNMSNYEIERSSVEEHHAKNSSSAEYYSEINQIQLQTFIPSLRQNSMPWQLATADVEEFLQKMAAS
jgi:hypothetical protein